MRIHYVICAYLGPRRNTQNSDPFCHLKQHLKFLKKNQSNIYKCTIVCNRYDLSLDKEIPKIIKNYRMPIIMDLIYRENTGGSYAAWQEAVIKNITLDYHFLIEDDYVPATTNFLHPFLQLMDHNTAYVCQFYAEVSGNQAHPAISNGLLSGSLTQKIYQKYQTIFRLLDPNKIWENATNYNKLEWNQVHYLDHFSKEGYETKDIKTIAGSTHQCRSIGAMGFRFSGFGTNNVVITPDGFLLLHHKLC